MPKRPISLTLEAGNLLWLKSRTAAQKRRSVSETLDALIADARQAGASAAGIDARSVVGTLDIAGDDPLLEHAKGFVGDLFHTSLSRPMLVRGGSAGRGPGRKKATRRG